MSATDAVRDRPAAFYHWDDRESLQAALAIARRQTINVSKIRRWSAEEGQEQKFHEFTERLGGRIQGERHRRRDALLGRRR